MHFPFITLEYREKEIEKQRERGRLVERDRERGSIRERELERQFYL